MLHRRAAGTEPPPPHSYGMGKWAGFLILAIVVLAVVGFLVDAVRVLAWIALIVCAAVLAGRWLMGRKSG